MIFSKTKKAFTMVELMAAITILALLLLGISSLNVNNISTKQKAEVYANKFINVFEDARNNALLGKGVGAGLVVPDSWKIQYNSNGAGYFRSNYGIGGTFTQYEGVLDDNGRIDRIIYENISGGTVNLTNGEVGEIEIISQNMSLTGTKATQDRKRVIIELSYGTAKKNIEINLMNGIAKVID